MRQVLVNLHLCETEATEGSERGYRGTAVVDQMEVTVTDVKGTMLWTFEHCKEQALYFWSLNVAFDALAFPGSGH
eukprot:10733285-Alexandrium_andersonii.AAC.1